ncbi:unnamed protein product [Linum tenue]|uniref:Ubiquitin-like protease family profile domain-containing protein n=1 Tax=Linum tenue TaxID=586396 RepID=A0AAV0NVP6_9ROSI|nr:unnamed protein product [Linum tenue]
MRIGSGTAVGKPISTFRILSSLHIFLNPMDNVKKSRTSARNKERKKTNSADPLQENNGPDVVCLGTTPITPSKRRARTNSTLEEGGPSTPLQSQPKSDFIDSNETERDPQVITSMEFHIPRHIELKFDELVVACYAFGRGLLEDEVLVHSLGIQGQRKAFMSLCPGKALADDVLTMVCSYLSQKQLMTENVEICFLPPDFSASLMTEDLTCQEALDKYQYSFMQISPQCSKVYIPMKDENDWFLLVVDLKSKEAIILQALYLDDRTSIREEAVKTMLTFLDKLAPLMCSWDGDIPKISEFHITKPIRNYSAFVREDSGAWVCQWMFRTELFDNYDVAYVDEGIRMKIAVRLLLSPYNINRATTLKLAHKFAQNCHHIIGHYYAARKEMEAIKDLITR